MPGLADINRLEDIDEKAIAACVAGEPGADLRASSCGWSGRSSREQRRRGHPSLQAIAREHKLPLMVHFGDGRRRSGAHVAT